MHLSTTTDAQQNLGSSLLEVHLQRHKREPLLFAFQSKLDDLTLVQQQFSLATGLVIEKLAGIRVGRDLAVDQKDLAIDHVGKRFGQLKFAIAKALHLAAGQLDTAFQVLQNVVFVPSFAVFADALLVLVFFFFRSF